MNCPICKGSILDSEETKVCDECDSTFHLSCWLSNGGCAIFGCPNVPNARDTDSSIVEEVWDSQSTQICPACRETTSLTRDTCPYCGQRLRSDGLVTTDELRRRLSRRSPKPKGRMGAITVFVLGLLGCTAPLNLLFGWIWYRENQTTLRESHPQYNLIAVLGLSFSVFYALLALISLAVS